MTGKRGMMIVIEGLDRSGKSTQSTKLFEYLKSKGHKVEQLKFPDRNLQTGKLADSYLKQSCQLDDHAMHLIFAANRWEKVPEIMDKLKSGVSLIVDRYSYSGVAYSAAKRGMSLDWCKQPEVGLPKPDAVIYLNVPLEVAAQRSHYGTERYENVCMQRRTSEVYQKLIDEDYWKVINADSSVDAIHEEIVEHIEDIHDKCCTSKIATLWSNESIL